MADIIWGNGSSILSNDSFVINITHRKDGNKKDYSDNEKIRITKADLPGLPLDKNEWNYDTLNNCLVDAFLKCEIESEDESGILLAKVSHSGAGGY